MYYIYCDESCHLENDNTDIMILGAITCPEYRKREVFEYIRKLKLKHGLSSWYEIKWTKVSQGKLDFYLDLVNYFHRNDDLSFRAVIATGKSRLDHSLYNENDFNLWYYKMYYQLLEPIIHTSNEYKIFIDIKDTNGGEKVRKLKQILRNRKSDYRQRIIGDICQINSNDSEILQMTDLFIGSLSFFHRGLHKQTNSSEAKKQIINYIASTFNCNLKESTPRDELKFNLFIWEPRGSN